MQPSMGPIGDCYDNALCESFNATLECELAELAIFDFIEGWYNPRRRHTALANISPMEFERRKAPAA